MKRLALNYIFIAALVFSAAFTSCGSRGSGGVKLLENISESESALNEFGGDSLSTSEFQNDRQEPLFSVAEVKWGMGVKDVTLKFSSQKTENWKS